MGLNVLTTWKALENRLERVQKMKRNDTSTDSEFLVVAEELEGSLKELESIWIALSKAVSEKAVSLVDPLPFSTGENEAKTHAHLGNSVRIGKTILKQMSSICPLQWN